MRFGGSDRIRHFALALASLPLACADHIVADSSTERMTKTRERLHNLNDLQKIYIYREDNSAMTSLIFNSWRRTILFCSYALW